MYSNNLLDRLTLAKGTTKIGPIICVALACADDVAVTADSSEIMQSLLDIGVDNSKMERFILQPVKSVILEILYGLRWSATHRIKGWDLDGARMPTVDKTMHVGICRSADSDESAVTENIKKARRTMYSLMSAGLHGENGLDPENSLHLYQTYVLPVLLYGIEVILPRQKYMDMLDKFNKRNIKHILSLPTTTADPAIYILSGALPVEAIIHQRALTFFGSIARLPETSVEKQLVTRQFSVKSMNSCSWFIAVKKLSVKYGLPDCVETLENTPTKKRWRTTVYKAVCQYWIDRHQAVIPLYPSLKWLEFNPGQPLKRHPLIESSGCIRDISRIAVHLKIVTGTYILQTNRVAFNQNEVDPTCILCKASEETLGHLLLECETLDSVRQPIPRDIKCCLNDCNINLSDQETLIQIITDCTAVVDQKTIPEIIFHARRLCYSLHIERYKRLSIVPRRKRTKKPA